MTRAAVLGSPIAHSLSPALHRAAYRELGLDWTYDAIDVDDVRLPAFLARLDSSWAGLSLTMPLKEAVIPLLAEVDDLALQITSVNTVVPGEAGWRGANTDVYGIVEAVRPHQPGTQSALVLGAGATARSALAALAAIGVAQVTIAGRRPGPTQAVTDLARLLGMQATAVDFTPRADLMQADLVVSTVPGNVGSGWAAECRTAGGVLLDASYHPWPTPLASAWPTSRVASGRDMLLWQAVGQVQLMTGCEAPVAAMAAALTAAEANGRQS